MAAYGYAIPDPDPEALMGAALLDKKNRSGKILYVPLAGVGRPALPPPHTAPLTLGALKWASERVSGTAGVKP